jgi:hypothetical protein
VVLLASAGTQVGHFYHSSVVILPQVGSLCVRIPQSKLFRALCHDLDYMLCCAGVFRSAGQVSWVVKVSLHFRQRRRRQM